MATDKMKEKRKFPRVSDGIKVIYKYMGVIGEKKDQVVDVSQGGIKILLKEKSRPGTLLELGVSMPHDPSPFFSLAKVAWQSDKRILGSDKQLYYETGVQFLKMDMQHKMLLIEYIYDRIKKEKKSK